MKYKILKSFDGYKRGDVVDLKNLDYIRKPQNIEVFEGEGIVEKPKKKIKELKVKYK